MRRMSMRSLPRPMIIARRRPTCRVAMPQGRRGPGPCCAHAPDAVVETDKDRLADEEMADIELDDFRERGDGAAVAWSRPWPACTSRPRSCGGPCALSTNAPPLALGLVRVRLRQRLAIGAGVQLDDRRAECARRLRSGGIGIDEQRDADAGIASSATDGRQQITLPTTSSPPSVVRSVRFSGTRQAACGFA